MRRIIQEYQEGGVVQSAPGPAVATGIPQGGHAAAAIQSYLSGQAAGPLSYTAGQSTVPDYRALADSRRKLRESLAASGLDAATQSSIVNEADTTNSSSGQIETLGGGVIKYSSAGEKKHAESIAKIIEDGGINEATGQANISSGPNVLSSGDAGLFGLGDTYTDQFQENYDAQSAHAADNPYGQSTGTPLSNQNFYDSALTGLANNSLIGKAGEFITGNEMLPDSSYLLPQPVTYIDNNDDNNDFHKEMMQKAADAAANPYGQTTGGVGLGTGSLLPPSSSNDDNSSTTTTTSNSGGGWANSGWNPKNWNNGGDVTDGIQTYNDGSAGGVAVAKSGLREDEIRQRQLMQARMPQVEASPLSGIGSKLAMGAVNKGIGSAASSMAAKEGLVGTLGNALGGSATTGLATGAAGTGMMAALGPIGIGIGLGKLFGLFNDGGKVPCSCGKTSCKCAKEIKSPLSGE